MEKRRSLKILFVGDFSIGHLIKEEMEDAGYIDDFHIEPFPEIAKQMLKEQNCPFDLLLSGGRIQQITNAGPELVRFARNQCPEMRIILITIMFNESEALFAGADKHLISAVEFDKLYKTIDGLFSQ
jgi:hypothetical protein